MSEVNMMIKYLDNYKGEPMVYAKPGDAGFDLRAAIPETVILAPGEQVIIPCGFKMSLPEGWEMQIRPRSGLAAKHGISITNSPGTVDAGYRGEVMVILINLSGATFYINPGDRIAQGCVKEVPLVTFEVVDELPESIRGEGGHGSTGVK